MPANRAAEAPPARAPLVLASGSPRRRDLLAEAGIAFRAGPVEIDEDAALAAAAGGAPERIAVALAARKALARASLEPADAAILAADTIVVAPGGELLAKPRDGAEAAAMIARLAGREHRVVTGVALLEARTGALRTRAVSSEVRFRALTAAEVDAYVKTDLWRGKAGGYGVQDEPSLVAEVRGSRSNVVGLPMEALAELLATPGPTGIQTRPD